MTTRLRALHCALMTGAAGALLAGAARAQEPPTVESVVVTGVRSPSDRNLVPA
ncbi:MAG: hypothetical protein JWO33_2732, partial [Caulobacteraceae bacterium]|nr:hypothetical protein [Caulobacteraceae bacterium]